MRNRTLSLVAVIVVVFFAVLGLAYLWASMPSGGG